MRYLLVVLLLLIMTSTASAEVFMYQDNAGKWHGVSAADQVPAEYRDQLKTVDDPDPRAHEDDLRRASIKCQQPGIEDKGVIRGRFYLITNGGDVRPVRKESVFILRNDFSDTGIAKEDSDKLKGEYGYAILTSPVLQKIISDHKTLCEYSVFTTTTDLDGNFSYTGLPDGFYEISCIGRGGINEAVWFDTFIISNGKPSTLIDDDKPLAASAAVNP